MRGHKNYIEITELLNSFLHEINIYCKGFGFQDLYNYAEEALIPILNITFNKKFSLLEKEKPNYPAIDLGSSDYKLSVQISANKDVDNKIKQTVFKFIKHQENEKYEHLKILLLQTELKFNITKNKINTYLKEKLTNRNVTLNDIGFDLQEDVIDITGLAQLMRGKPNIHENVISALRNQLDYLKKANKRKKFIELRALNEEIQHLNIVDALYTLTQKLNGLFYLPYRFKRQVYPFSVKIDEYRNEVANFTFDCCKTWNEELVEFLCYTEKFKDKFTYVGENATLKNVKIDKYKIDEIFKFLGNNNINIVQYGSGRCKQVFDLHNYQLHTCNYYSFKKLNFKKSLNETRINLRCSDNNLYKLLQRAYFLFRFGFLKKSFTQLDKLSMYSKKRNYHLLHFVCEYNIVYLQSVLSKHYTDEWEGFSKKEKERILKRNNENNLYDLITGFQDDNVNKDIVQILQWIKDDLYIEEFAYSISIILEYSLKRYYNERLEFTEENNEQLIDEIKYTVYECKNIVFGNFLFKSESKKFKGIVYKSIEALILLLKLNKKKNIEAIPMEDFFINLIVFYFQSHDLIEFLEKYEVHKIDVVKTNPDQNFDIIEMLQNFSYSKNSLKDVLEEQNKNGVENFKYEFPQLLDNLIILTHYLNLNEDKFNEAIKYIVQIFAIIEVRGLFHNPFYYLFKIVDLDKHRLAKENLKAIVQLKKLHKNVEFEFYNLYDLPQFKSDKNSFINRKIKYFKKPTKTLYMINYYEIYHYIDLCNKNQKSKFIKIIEDRLDEQFDKAIFHSFCLNGYLSFKKYEDKFISTINNDLKPTIDKLIDLAYTFSINLKQKKYQIIKENYLKFEDSNPEKINYCNFLFDPKNFNFKNFDSKWLLRQPYWRMQKLSKIKTVKETLLKNINENDNKELALLYVNYFVKSTKR